MQKPLRGKRDLPSPTSTGARWWSRASSSSAPPGMRLSGKHRQQQERKKYSQVHCYLEELNMVSKENNDFSTFKLRFPQLITVKGLVFYFSLLVKLMLLLRLLSSPRLAPTLRYQWVYQGATNFVIC